MRASKVEPCVDCGRESLRKDLNRKGRCHDCRIKILRDNMSQLMAHAGPHYEKWKRSVQAAASKL